MKSGFTLINLLIVVGIIAILVAMVSAIIGDNPIYRVDAKTGIKIVTLNDGHDYNKQFGYYNYIYSHAAECKKCEERWKHLLENFPAERTEN